MTVNRACRGQNLLDVLRVDDLARRCRGAMTPRAEPEKLAVLLMVLLAVLLQLAVLTMVLTMVAVLPMVQLAEQVLVMWASWAALLQEPRSEAAGWEAMVAQQPLEQLAQTVRQTLVRCWLRRGYPLLPILSQVSWPATPEFFWPPWWQSMRFRQKHYQHHPPQLFWHAWVCQRSARASSLFLRHDVAHGRLAHRPCSSRACRHRHQFLRTSR